MGLLQIELFTQRDDYGRWSEYDPLFQKLTLIDDYSYISPNLMVQQTRPLRIHQPRSVCLRHLGELAPTVSLCCCYKRKFEKWGRDRIEASQIIHVVANGTQRQSDA
jgi:hypothetical protein